MIFLDEAVVNVRAGDGGRGCVAFRREKFVPRGGPSGGDGGHGGSVYFVAGSGVNTLYHLRFSSLFRAERGRHGEGSKRTGRTGADLKIPAPLGTLIEDAESGELLGELLVEHDRVLVARGGRGGRGNAAFATATRQAPRYAQPGDEGQERTLRVELKLLADVGVVGLPNAGKSTLISVITAAKPKVADYPFTTLVPQLGVVGGEVVEDPFVIADLPGLIAGAARGAGLGIRFLRHIERCRVLVHLVDLAGGESGAEVELATVEKEREEFDSSLVKRPRLVVGTKIDARSEDRAEELKRAAAHRGLGYHEISSVTRKGLERLVIALGELLAETQAPVG